MISRRQSLLGLGALTGLSAISTAAPPVRAAEPSKALGPANFRFTGTYINGAYTHPMSLAAAEASAAFLRTRVDPTQDVSAPDARTLFAQLINAEPHEIAYIPSTMYGENLIVSALGLGNPAGQKVITDILHFEGSLFMYQELAKQGLDLAVLRMNAQGAIDMNQLEDALASGAKLVAISLVSWVNGFQHDLKTVCDLAHRKGALVYVDAIQGAGAVPIDVRASGVDFLACASFKWLMGDFGCGCLYVREDLLPRVKRMVFGYRQFETMNFSFLPGDPPGPLFQATPDDRTAKGRFEVGTVGAAARTALGVSLSEILATGVHKIQARRQPLVDRLRTGLGRTYPCLTPLGTMSPIISFSCRDAEAKLGPRLAEAGISISLYDTHFRVSPSVYNSMPEIDRLIGVLSS